MIPKDFWRNSKIGVVGGGSWGMVLANLAAVNCREVRVWLRDDASVRSMNATRSHAVFSRGNASVNPNVLQLHEQVHAYSSLERFFEGGLHCILWALPSSACRELAMRSAHLFQGDEMVLHATKGIEPGSMKRISEVLAEELPCRRIGVVSGPNLAREIAAGEPAATIIASVFQEVCEAGQALLGSDRFRTYRATDVIGVEWAGSLKNILAIASGALDALSLGWNARAMLITRGLAEMVRFGVAMGAQESTFLGLAGIGDLMATCSSSLSRNYQVGFRLAKGDGLNQVLGELGSTAEGVMTTQSVWEYAHHHRISMPITEGVFHLLREGVPAIDVLHQLMSRPASSIM